MGSESNKAIVERWWKVSSASAMLDRLNDTYAETYVLHDPSSPEPVVGLQGVRDFISSVAAGFPNAVYTLHDSIAEGDKLAQRIQVVGTHKGEFFGIPATGKPVDLQMHVVSRFQDGKNAEEWLIFGTLTMLKQLGTIE